MEVVKSYPRQSLWYVFGKANSRNESVSTRNGPMTVIIQSLRLKIPVPPTSQMQGQTLAGLITSGQKFVDVLTKFTYVEVPRQSSSRMTLRQFPFDMSSIPCGLVVPVQFCMRATLPTVPAAMKHHSAFPKYSVITIAKIDENVDIMSSLQKPKKIVLYGSNGVRYKILCKSQDDVRKDSRLMDLTCTIDTLLQRNDNAFKRRLSIKTYFVTPLTDDSGLIEWVDGMRPLREILRVGYSGKGIQANWQEAQELLSPDKDQIQGYRKLIAKYPPVLKEWFLEMFPEPSSWLDSRNKYAKTLAVMSMVGYILGLGDRHGENILFDDTSGGIMHVDFDCLFDKGKDLETPELVPFRLTPNMVDALGVCGYEGIFRKSSEVTMELMRMYEDMVMTVLDVFLHDPINDWSRKRRSSSKHKRVKGFGAARSPEEALSSIQNKIRGGHVEEVMPMKVPGQVSYLIAEATDEQNLAYMYVGWMAFW